MNLFGVMDVSASALQAERVRAQVVAVNMANAETTRTAEGGPYQRQHVVFEAQTGDGFANSLMENAGWAGGSMLAGGMMPMAGLPGGLDDAVTAPGGVAVTGVIRDTSAPLRRYEPGHPDADADGFVSYPDINPLTEMVDLMGATRSYGMNASAIQAEKTMFSTSLDILKS
jgi:flagellar basal-body rod protein FlgC